MIVRQILIAAAALTVTTVGGEAAELRLSHSAQANLQNELHTAAWLFKNHLDDFSETVEVTIYPNNALGEEREVYEAMQLGSGADCVISGTAILGNFNEKIGVLDLPFLWQDFDHAHAVLDGEVGDGLAQELSDSGFKVLAWMDSWGYRNVVTADRPVDEPADLEGLKLRTIPTETYIAAINAMGANATPMAFGEIYTAMETGVLDGLEHSAAMILANRFYEVADNIALTRHLFGPLVFACSNQFWNSLSAEEQAEVQEAANFARDIERSLAPVREAEAFNALREAGMTIREIDTTPMREAAMDVQEELAGEMGAGNLLVAIREAGSN